jgi:chaperonin cofactor prefoldin
MNLSFLIQELISQYQEIEEKVNQKIKEISALEEQKNELVAQAWSISSKIINKIKKENSTPPKFKLGDIVFAKRFKNITLKVIKSEYISVYGFKPFYLLEEEFDPFYYFLNVHDDSCYSFDEDLEKFLDEGCNSSELELATSEKQQKILEEKINEYQKKISDLGKK